MTASQRQEIDYLVNNPPALEYPENPVIPTRQTQTIRPTPPFYGIGRLEVDGYTPNNQNKNVTPSTTEQTVTAGESYDGLGVVTVEPAPLESKTVTPIREEITYTPTTPNIGFSSVTVEAANIPYGGIYINEINNEGYPVKFLIKDYEKALSAFPQFFDKTGAAGIAIKEIVFENCPNISSLPQNFASNLPNLNKFVLPENLTSMPANLVSGCASMTELVVPNKVTDINFYAASICYALKKLFLPKSLTSVHQWAFFGDSALEFVTLENGFNCNYLNLSASTLYSAETILSWFNALADRTGETAYTLTIGTTNLNKMTDEEKAIAINKNWNLA